MVLSNLTEAETVVIAADVAQGLCALNHGPETKAEDYPAVDAFVVPIGRQLSEVEFEEIRKLIIPVCKDCVASLHGNEWTLIYCMSCSGNHWVHRASARLRYRHHVLWLNGCQECTGKFGGLYFADQEFSVEDFPNAPSEDF